MARRGTSLATSSTPSKRLHDIIDIIACEFLRELEHAHPFLLSDVVGHLWALAQAERTHAAQSYLLLAAVVRNIALHGLLSSPSSILSTSTPLVPFSAPQSLFSSFHPNREPFDLNLREIRRVMAFLLERPHALTPPATKELVSMLPSIAGVLEQRVSALVALLKVQFSGLLYSYDPILCHVVLMLYSASQMRSLGKTSAALPVASPSLPGSPINPSSSAFLLSIGSLACPGSLMGRPPLLPWHPTFTRPCLIPSR